MDHSNSQTVSIVVTVIVLALVLGLRWRRMGRSRPLKLEQLYVLPLIYAALCAILLVERPPDPTGWLWCGVALLIGAAIGWYRGRLVAITVDPATHTLNQKASPAAFLFLAAIVVIRVALRSVVAEEASSWHVDPATIIDAFLMLALGLIAVQRLEMYLRGRRLLAEAGAPR